MLYLFLIQIYLDCITFILFQVSFALSEWLIKNKNEFNKKTILELGSGTGLAGLILLMISKPSSYYFSDCHHEVLKQLCSNIILNIKNNEKSDFARNILINDNDKYIYWQYKFSESNINILNLSWEFINDYNLNDIKPDIIVGSGK